MSQKQKGQRTWRWPNSFSLGLMSLCILESIAMTNQGGNQCLEDGAVIRRESPEWNAIVDTPGTLE
ncbi:hypothetical protein [Candidatus Symbiobacter mobilis]|uniref:hypothetical protein n=1 Tax=Candidatus Symbiobacter mobilis TaxID=1436290 RepID=UPI001248FFE6|nr:hypothetical protein [Candidatus Symbiobacter mobilis]